MKVEYKKPVFVNVDAKDFELEVEKEGDLYCVKLWQVAHLVKPGAFFIRNEYGTLWKVIKVQEAGAVVEHRDNPAHKGYIEWMNCVYINKKAYIDYSARTFKKARELAALVKNQKIP